MPIELGTRLAIEDGGQCLPVLAADDPVAAEALEQLIGKFDGLRRFASTEPCRGTIRKNVGDALLRQIVIRTPLLRRLGCLDQTRDVGKLNNFTQPSICTAVRWDAMSACEHGFVGGQQPTRHMMMSGPPLVAVLERASAKTSSLLPIIAMMSSALLISARHLVRSRLAGASSSIALRIC